MIDTEDLLEAMVRGVLKENYDKVTQVQMFQIRNQFMDLLVPILPLITQAKHDAWEEGSAAQDTYIRDSWLSTEMVEEPSNPYWVA